MKVLLINGSAHKEGCTFTALSEIARTLNENGVETEIFHIGSKPVGGCTGCGGCKKTGHCVLQDDAYERLSAMLARCDGFVIGSPGQACLRGGQLPPGRCQRGL